MHHGCAYLMPHIVSHVTICHYGTAPGCQSVCQCKQNTREWSGSVHEPNPTMPEQLPQHFSANSLQSLCEIGLNKQTVLEKK